MTRDPYELAAEDAGIPQEARDSIIEAVRSETQDALVEALSEAMHARFAAGIRTKLAQDGTDNGINVVLSL